jgi:hypothetical protein
MSVVNVDPEDFRAALWPSLQTMELGKWVNDNGWGVHVFVTQACRQWGARTGTDVPNSLHYIAHEFLWDAVRVGLLVPTHVNGSGGTPYGNVSFNFTEAGNQWRDASDDTLNPFAQDFERELLKSAPIMQEEPIALVTEARLAYKSGLRRASLFLLGLMNEDLVAHLFDAGTKSKRIVPKAAKGRSPQAWAIQQDVHDALTKLEGSSIEKGTAAAWDALVHTLRNYRNRCAHESNYLPSANEVYAALFMLPSLAEKTQAAHSAVSR